jgi:hypothetical protein
VLSTILRPRAFRLPDWNCCAQRSNSESNNEAPNGELREAEAAAFQDLANESKYCGEEDSLASA